jgi:hypothetical protein
MTDVYSFGVLLAFLFTGKHSSTVPPDVQVCPSAPFDHCCLVQGSLARHICLCGRVGSMIRCVYLRPVSHAATLGWLHDLCVYLCPAMYAATLGRLHDPCVYLSASRGATALLSPARLAVHGRGIVTVRSSGWTLRYTIATALSVQTIKEGGVSLFPVDSLVWRLYAYVVAEPLAPQVKCLETLSCFWSTLSCTVGPAKPSAVHWHMLEAANAVAKSR